jgi:hypothetical protein
MVASTVYRAATSGFVVSSRGYLGDPVVVPHEVGVFSKLSDDFTCVVPLGLLCYRGDRHKALLMSSVHPVGDLIQSLIDVPDGRASRRCRC